MEGYVKAAVEEWKSCEELIGLYPEQMHWGGSLWGWWVITPRRAIRSHFPTPTVGLGPTISLWTMETQKEHQLQVTDSPLLEEMWL